MLRVLLTCVSRSLTQYKRNQLNLITLPGALDKNMTLYKSRADIICLGFSQRFVNKVCSIFQANISVPFLFSKINAGIHLITKLWSHIFNKEYCQRASMTQGILSQCINPSFTERHIYTLYLYLYLLCFFFFSPLFGIAECWYECMCDILKLLSWIYLIHSWWVW